MEGNTETRTLSGKDIYKFDMFPMMLQAIYNAKIVLGYKMNHCVSRVEAGDGVRKTYNDLDLIIDAFKSIGITKRCPKDVDKFGFCTLTHFNDMDMAELLETFSPFADERDEYVEHLRETFENTHRQQAEAVQKRNTKINELSERCNHLTQEILRLKDEAKRVLIPKRWELRLNNCLNAQLTTEEMRQEIKNILLDYANFTQRQPSGDDANH